MKLQLISTEKISVNEIAVICSDTLQLDRFGFTDAEKIYIEQQFINKQQLVEINQYSKRYYICKKSDDKQEFVVNEKLRKAGAKLTNAITKAKAKSVAIVDCCNHTEGLLAFTVGAALEAYQFLDYFSKSVLAEKKNALAKIYVVNGVHEKIEELQNVIAAVFHCRNLINTPPNHQSAEEFALAMKQMGEEAGYSTDIYDKKKIEALKFGGLLAVNKGSFTPPTFTVMEWKPENSQNTKPIVLVGKGVVYDTGGLSLKPTPNSMDTMKSDMSGGAVVAGIMYAVAKNKLPIHLIGLVPATDNRPGNKAFTPGDIIEMHDGTTVENLNSDAEGRYLLADGLSFAKKYKPELVIDIATLTGAAHYCIGSHASVVMGTADRSVFKDLESCGQAAFERVVEFPLWDEYGEAIKSKIADIKNIGGPVAGAITAGKFLEHFTDFPWIHNDIAGTAYAEKPAPYTPVGGTGKGIRRYYNFFKNYNTTK